MDRGRVLALIALECKPEDDAKFNKWYSEVHIPMLLNFKGCLGVTRYRTLGDPKEQARYMTIYEFADRASMDAFHKSPEMVAAGDDVRMSEMGKVFSIKWRAQYEEIKSWRK
jgi:uncharacterized protein (TIGR02118 family)